MAVMTVEVSEHLGATTFTLKASWDEVQSFADARAFLTEVMTARLLREAQDDSAGSDKKKGGLLKTAF